MIWALLIVFQIKHFAADYPLQNQYMLGKFKSSGWVKPLAAHCGVQAFFTFVISLWALWFTPGGLVFALGLSALDFSIHFAMDRIKASPRLLGCYESISKDQYKGLMESKALCESVLKFNFNEPPKTSEMRLEAHFNLERINSKFKSNKYFWWSLGLDQMIHHLTDILIIFLILENIK
jgi:hypothetical protein